MMNIHERAWDGLDICIVGSTPLVPMQIEQSLSDVSPSNECRIESFESYEEAYGYCKSSKNVGCIFLLEDCGNLPCDSVFRELAKYYEMKGLPCFGVLLHDGDESTTGYSCLARDRRFLDYLPLDSLRSTNLAGSYLKQIWNRYCKGFEEHSFPKVLQRTFTSIAEGVVDSNALHFYVRASNIIQPKLNLSWFNVVSIQWHLVLSTVMDRIPSAIQPHAVIVSLVESSRPDFDWKNLSLEQIARQDSPLQKRFTALLLQLTKCLQEGILKESLIELNTHSRPGAPALIRNVCLLQNQIEQIIASKQDIQRAV